MSLGRGTLHSQTNSFNNNNNVKTLDVTLKMVKRDTCRISSLYLHAWETGWLTEYATTG